MKLLAVIVIDHVIEWAIDGLRSLAGAIGPVPGGRAARFENGAGGDAQGQPFPG